MLTTISLCFLAISAGYVVFATVRVLVFARRANPIEETSFTPPVTIVKPIAGLEVELAENLRSFCKQDYPDYQIVFGVQSPDDPAIPVVQQIIEEFPNIDMELVIDERNIGTNYKVSNIANIAERAKHEILVISDSDIRVDPRYLATAIQPFEDPNVGASTSLYTASGRGGFASTLSAMFVNDWFLPSALIPMGFGPLTYCFGATIAVRKHALDQAGGFAALANYLADDYMLGRLVTGAGYKIAFVPYVPDNIMHEPSIASAFMHELRWARTIRSLQPIGYLMSTVTEVIPISIFAAVALALDGYSGWIISAPLIVSLLLRILLHSAVSFGVHGGKTFVPWLIPVRDVFSFSVRVTSFCGSRVVWRGNAFTVKGDNRIQVSNVEQARDKYSSHAT